MEHLKNIFEVCKQTPGTRHWLPTQERKYLTLMDPEVVPENLIIRLSRSKIDGPASNAWPFESGVTLDDKKEHVQPRTRATSAAAVERAGIKTQKLLYTETLKT